MVFVCHLYLPLVLGKTFKAFKGKLVQFPTGFCSKEEFFWRPPLGRPQVIWLCNVRRKLFKTWFTSPHVFLQDSNFANQEMTQTSVSVEQLTLPGLQLSKAKMWPSVFSLVIDGVSSFERNAPLKYSRASCQHQLYLEPSFTLVIKFDFQVNRSNRNKGVGASFILIFLALNFWWAALATTTSGFLLRVCECHCLRDYCFWDFIFSNQVRFQVCVANSGWSHCSQWNKILSNEKYPKDLPVFFSAWEEKSGILATPCALPTANS